MLMTNIRELMIGPQAPSSFANFKHSVPWLGEVRKEKTTNQWQTNDLTYKDEHCLDQFTKKTPSSSDVKDFLVIYNHINLSQNFMWIKCLTASALHPHPPCSPPISLPLLTSLNWSYSCSCILCIPIASFRECFAWVYSGFSFISLP